ncbi:hypothetical protein RUM43_013374 [Polyplax serrata]|uniref:Folliculin n=1 Tax=Polyplax serrata TaxID=468196 RepID=A0AAN8P1X3_POLSC
MGNLHRLSCCACEASSGYITNDYQNKISFLSTRLAIDPNVSSLMKQAAVRSLSCEVVPDKEGQVYFGDTARGHILSNTFFLKDSQARGFHRWYSVVVFMKDKHFLLNSWPFFERHINQIIKDLQRKATQVYLLEQNICSQRVLRLSNADQKYSTARSLPKLTDCATIFAQLHIWFTWLLSVGAKRLEEFSPPRLLNNAYNDSKKRDMALNLTNEFDLMSRIEVNPEKWYIWHFKKLRTTLGSYDFHRLIYSTLIGRQIIIRGPRLFVSLLINILKLILPVQKFRCINYSQQYRTPDVCNILGLDSYAAVPKSCDKLMRLDIVPGQELENRQFYQSDETFNFHKLLLKSESALPEKLPTLLVKIDKVLSDGTLSDNAVSLHISSLIEEWHHTADLLREAKGKGCVGSLAGLMRILGVQEQDELVINFCMS